MGGALGPGRSAGPEATGEDRDESTEVMGRKKETATEVGRPGRCAFEAAASRPAGPVGPVGNEREVSFDRLAAPSPYVGGPFSIYSCKGRLRWLCAAGADRRNQRSAWSERLGES